MSGVPPGEGDVCEILSRVFPLIDLELVSLSGHSQVAFLSLLLLRSLCASLLSIQDIGYVVSQEQRCPKDHIASILEAKSPL